MTLPMPHCITALFTCEPATTLFHCAACSTLRELCVSHALSKHHGQRKHIGLAEKRDAHLSPTPRTGSSSSPGPRGQVPLASFPHGPRENCSPHSPSLPAAQTRLSPTSWTWPKSQWIGCPGKSASARSSSRRRWNSWMAFSSTQVRQNTAARCSTLETSTPSHRSFIVPLRAAGGCLRCPPAPRRHRPL